MRAGAWQQHRQGSSQNWNPTGRTRQHWPLRRHPSQVVSLLSGCGRGQGILGSKLHWV